VDEPLVSGDVIDPNQSEMSDAGAVTSYELEQALVNRWNTVPLATQPVDDFGMRYNFLWPSFGEFPHPTFKGGSEIAYQSFARVLLAFMQAGDNFEFLANTKVENLDKVSNLFDLLIGEAAESGRVEVGWTFRTLVGQFASDTKGVFANIDATTRGGLTEVAKRIPPS
jgi:hypothetical protein